MHQARNQRPVMRRVAVAACSCIDDVLLASVLHEVLPADTCRLGKISRYSSVESVLVHPAPAKRFADAAIDADCEQVILIARQGCPHYARYYRGGQPSNKFLTSQREEHFKCALTNIRARSNQRRKSLTYRCLLVQSCGTVKSVPVVLNGAETIPPPSRMAHRQQPRRAARARARGEVRPRKSSRTRPGSPVRT